VARAGVTHDGHLMWHCPGCDSTHEVPIKGDDAWEWNQSTYAPTVDPSILIFDYDTGITQCHCRMKDGMIYFFGDSSHKLAERTVDMDDDFVCVTKAVV